MHLYDIVRLRSNRHLFLSILSVDLINLELNHFYAYQIPILLFFSNVRLVLDTQQR
jgi:hypothetical protein